MKELEINFFAEQMINAELTSDLLSKMQFFET